MWHSIISTSSTQLDQSEIKIFYMSHGVLLNTFVYALPVRRELNIKADMKS